MASYTENYALTKPTMAESADIRVINSNMDKVDDVMHSTQISLAPAYDMHGTYNTGDVVMYELLMYECLEDEVTGAWDATKWQRTTAGEHGGGSDVEVTQIQTEGKAVASIAVDGTSTNILIPELKVYGEATGDLITIEDAMEAPLEECKVTLEPQQDLHGYDHPWAGGAGKNKLPLIISDIKSLNTSGTWNGNTYTINNVTFTIQTDDGGNVIGIATNGIANAEARIVVCDKILNLGSSEYYTLSGCPSGGDASTYNVGCWRAGNGSITEIGNGQTFSYSEPIRFVVSVNIKDGTNSANKVFQPMIESGSTATSFAPYSNICPIIGHTEANVVVSPTTSAEDGTTYTIQLGSTYYGGELDVKSGVLSVTDGYIASYNGETLPSTWISDRDVYAPNTSPTTGAEVVYKLATPTEITLTPTEVTLLRGINNLWSDGEMYVKWRRDIEILLQRIADSLGGNA